MKHFHDCFYSIHKRCYQDSFITKHCSVLQPKRKRPSKGNRKGKAATIMYSIRRKDGSKISVCRGTFLNCLRIKKDRILNVMKYYLTTGAIRGETRGGDRRSGPNKGKRQAVIQFIQKFHGRESHYSRNKNKRLYLSSELSIQKMWKMYNLEVSNESKVSISFFRNIFVRNFNLSFGSPRTDVCSTCLRLTESMKTENDQTKRQQLRTEKRIHKLRSGAFYTLLRERREGMVTLSFDCQKNQVLPKVPDSAAYYSRQLYMYNFTIVTKFTKEDTHVATNDLYCWTEDQGAKGSNEIASAVYHRLTSLDLTHIDKIRLVSDGCGGQNKNSTVIGMVAHWLATKAPSSVRYVEMIFPVTGHSYIPPDRVFGRLEKKIKMKEKIVRPENYIELYREVGTVHKLGQTWFSSNWKKSVAEVVKPTNSLPFMISNCKRFLFRKTLTKGNAIVTVQGEENFKSNLSAPGSIIKRGKSLAKIKPEQIEIGKAVSKKKLLDVDALLTKHYGNDWRLKDELQYFRDILDNPDAIEEEMPEEEACMCCGEDNNPVTV